MKLGLVGYTNYTSGIGLFIRELFDYLEADSILSVDNEVKGQDVWTDRQLTAGRPQTEREMRDYFERFEPDVVLFMETPFNEFLYPIAKQYGCKLASIPMHETFSAERLRSDLLICTCSSAWEKARIKNKKALFLPIGLELFPYRKRTGHTFVMNMGYGGVNDRRQSAIVLEAFSRLDGPWRLIVNSQARLKMLDDPRITYYIGTSPMPGDVYKEGDISICVMAYGGYERPILESMASGMPTITTDADPMNMYQHDHNFLVSPVSGELLNSQWVKDTVYNQVSVEDVLEKLQWLLTIDTEKYSERAYAQAVAQSWESPDFDYKSLWLNTLEELCSGQ